MYDIEGWINNEGSGTITGNGSGTITGNGNIYAPWAGPGTNVTTSWGGWDAPEWYRIGGGKNPLYGTLSTGSGVSDPSSFYGNDSISSGGGSSGSRGGGGSSSPIVTGRQSTTTTTGGGPLPTMATATFNLPTYTAPEYVAPSPYVAPAYDYNRINYLTTQQMAPQATKLRNALYAGIGKVGSTDNPYMQLQSRKALMQGYGGGLSEAAQGASKTAQQLYNTEYSGALDAEKTRYMGELSQAATKYQGALSASQTAYQGALTAAQANFSSQQAANSAAFNAALAEWQKSLTTTTTEQIAYNGQPFANTGAGLSEEELEYNRVKAATQKPMGYGVVTNDAFWRF